MFKRWGKRPWEVLSVLLLSLVVWQLALGHVVMALALYGGFTFYIIFIGGSLRAFFWPIHALGCLFCWLEYGTWLTVQAQRLEQAKKDRKPLPGRGPRLFTRTGAVLVIIASYGHDISGCRCGGGKIMRGKMKAKLAGG